MAFGGPIPDPSQDTKEQLADISVACILELGQSAKSLLHNSALRDVNQFFGGSKYSRT